MNSWVRAPGSIDHEYAAQEDKALTPPAVITNTPADLLDPPAFHSRYPIPMVHVPLSSLNLPVRRCRLLAYSELKILTLPDTSMVSPTRAHTEIHKAMSETFHITATGSHSPNPKPPPPADRKRKNQQHQQHQQLAPGCGDGRTTRRATSRRARTRCGRGRDQTYVNDRKWARPLCHLWVPVVFAVPHWFPQNQRRRANTCCAGECSCWYNTSLVTAT